MKIHYILFLFIFASCSVANLAVSNLDWIIYRQVKNRLDLYYKQQNDLEKEVSIFLSRQVQKLPKVETLLQRLESKIDSSDYTKEGVSLFRQDLSNLYIEIAGDFNSNILSKFLAQLDKDQIKHFQNENEEQNKELEEKLKSSKESDLTQRIEYFVGEFSIKQKQIVSSNLIHLKSLQEIRLIRRKKLQQDLYKMMSSSMENKSQLIQERFHQYIRKTDTPKSTIDKINGHRKFTDQMVVDVLKEMDIKQKEFIKKRIKFIRKLLDTYKKSYSKKD